MRKKPVAAVVRIAEVQQQDDGHGRLSRPLGANRMIHGILVLATPDVNKKTRRDFE